jgi:hypothetical protein
VNRIGKCVINSELSLKGFRYNSFNTICIIAFFIPFFFLTVKSWVTTSLFLLFFICLWQICSNFNYYFRNRSQHFWILLACLVAPFFAEIIPQIGRGEIVGSNLDGPSRMILAASVFVYLSRRDSSGLITFLSYGAACGVIGVFFSLLLFPDHYWGTRAATYFVDPITLPCFTVGLLGIFLFFSSRARLSTFQVSNIMLLLFMTAYIVIESGSRSAYIAVISLMLVFIPYVFRYSVKLQVVGFLSLVAALTLIYLFSNSVHSRVNESISGVISFIFHNGNYEYLVQKTSSGQRMVLGQLDIQLIKANWLFGFGDRATLPPVEKLMASVPLLTPEIHWIKALAGSHTEFLAQLVRQGVIFGSVTLLSLFFYPIYLFAWKHRDITFAVDSYAVGIFGILIPILASSLTIQVFNLKMTICFYGLCLAIFYGYLCHRIDCQRETVCPESRQQSK